MMTKDLGLFCSVQTVEPKDLPHKKEDLIVYVEKLKCTIETLGQDLGFYASLYNP